MYKVIALVDSCLVQLSYWISSPTTMIPLLWVGNRTKLILLKSYTRQDTSVVNFWPSTGFPNK
jgi:hypothetical protein